MDRWVYLKGEDSSEFFHVPEPLYRGELVIFLQVPQRRRFSEYGVRGEGHYNQHPLFIDRRRILEFM